MYLFKKKTNTHETHTQLTIPIGFNGPPSTHFNFFTPPRVIGNKVSNVIDKSCIGHPNSLIAVVAIWRSIVSRDLGHCVGWQLEIFVVFAAAGRSGCDNGGTRLSAVCGRCRFVFAVSEFGRGDRRYHGRCSRFQQVSCMIRRRRGNIVLEAAARGC